MDYAPENEQGVVFLFADLARRELGMRVESIQAAFPDCIGVQGAKRSRIEFEFRSSSFRAHGHDPKKCDLIVCWIDDWANAPPGLRIIELRRFYNLGFNVWIQAVRGVFRASLQATRMRSTWSVPRQARRGDLVLFHRASPDSYIADVFVLTKDATWRTADYKKGKDWMAEVQRVATLATPLHWEEMKRHHILGRTAFVRRNMQGRHCVTEFWPTLRSLILARNPGQRSRFARFGAERVSRG